MEDNQRLTRAHWLVMIAAFLGWMFDGFEMGLFPLAARPALRDIMATVTESGKIYPDEQAIGPWYTLFLVMFLLGAASGGLVFGWLGDRIGRVRAMALSIAVYSVFTGCVVFAWTPWQIAGYRFLAALGMGGEWALGVALVMECWPNRYRPMLAGAIGAASNVGFLLVSQLGIQWKVEEESWRWIMWVGALPGILAIFIFLFIPESERWKASVEKKRSQPIREIISGGLLIPTLFGICFAGIALTATWAAVSGFLPVWADQLAGGERTLKVSVMAADSGTSKINPISLTSDEHLAVSDALPLDSAPKDGAKTPYPDYRLQKTTFRKKSIAPGETIEYRLTISNRGKQEGPGVTVTDQVPLDLVSASSVAYDVPEGTDVKFDAASGTLTWEIGTLEFKDSTAKARVQRLLAIGAIFGCFLGSLLGNWLGRRPAYFLLCLGSLLSAGYLYLFLSEYNVQFLVVTVVVGMLTASFYGWLPLYLPELFPSRVRATGQGISFNFARILAAGGAALTGLLFAYYDGSYPKACATMILVYLIGMVLIWFAPETKGKPLPD